MKKVLFLFIGLLVSTLSHSAVINFSGALEYIQVNDGLNIFASASTGDYFSGSFSYGDNVGEGTTSGAGDYQFSSPPYTGHISSNGVTLQNQAGDDIEVGIGNDIPLDDDFTMVNNLLGTSYDESSIFDTWDIEGMDRDTSTNLEFAIGFLFDNTLYFDQNYRVSPPNLASIELAYFSIQIIDQFDQPTFYGYGKLSSISSIPEPSTLGLLIIGVLLLIVTKQIARLRLNPPTWSS